MKTAYLLPLLLLIIGCGENNDPNPNEPEVHDDYLVQLTCDKDTPTYLPQRQSLEGLSFFIGHPLRNGEPVPEAELKSKYRYFGDFYYKVSDTWTRCNDFDKGRAVTFGSNGYNQMSCSHPKTAPVELIVWVPAASSDGPESIDPSLGCTPTVEAPK